MMQDFLFVWDATDPQTISPHPIYQKLFLLIIWSRSRFFIQQISKKTAHSLEGQLKAYVLISIGLLNLL